MERNGIREEGHPLPPDSASLQLLDALPVRRQAVEGGFVQTVIEQADPQSVRLL